MNDWYKEIELAVERNRAEDVERHWAVTEEPANDLRDFLIETTADGCLENLTADAAEAMRLAAIKWALADYEPDGEQRDIMRREAMLTMMLAYMQSQESVMDHVHQRRMGR